MLTEASSNKQNHKIQGKDSLLNCFISKYKDQISILQQQKSFIKDKSQSQITQLKLQLSQCKKKINNLTEKYLKETMVKESRKEDQQLIESFQMKLRQKEMMLQQQRIKRKGCQERIKRAQEQAQRVKKQCTMLRCQKDKTMQIGLMQKIALEQKVRLCQEQITSKKKLLKGLKKQLEKAYADRQDLYKRQQDIQLKSKELNSYSQEVNQYNRLSDQKLKQKISYLSKENQFLKDYVKKLQKMAKKECACQGREDQVRENLFVIKRELALAKAKLSHNNQMKSRATSKEMLFSPQSCDEKSGSKRK